jgi:hypothetical protein
MLAPIGQAIDALRAGISGLLTNVGNSPVPQVFVLASKSGLSGIGGFVGLQDDPQSEIYSRKLDAEVAVRIFADTAAGLMAAEEQATRDMIGADTTFLRQSGFLAINRKSDAEPPMLASADGIPAPVGRDLKFSVQFEHRPQPTDAEGVMGAIPLDITQAALSGHQRLIYENNFDNSPLADFQSIDRTTGTGSAGNWAYNASSGDVIQTANTSGGNNGVAANKVGTYLVLNPGLCGALSDFTLNTEMQAGTTAGIGLVFRFVDADTFGWVLLENPASVRVMGKRSDGIASLLDQGGQDTTRGFDPDAWMRIRLLVSDDQFELAINEQTVLAGRDATLTQTGTVGFFCRRAITARFRHFRLSGL